MQIEFLKAAASLDLGRREEAVDHRRDAARNAAHRRSACKTGLQAPLADPLWMLARQWQFNEFQGEDAGTPLRLKFAVQGRPVDCVSARAPTRSSLAAARRAAARRSRRASKPKPVWKTHPRLRGEAGLHALRTAPSAALRDCAARPRMRSRSIAPTDADADQRRPAVVHAAQPPHRSMR